MAVAGLMVAGAGRLTPATAGANLVCGQPVTDGGGNSAFGNGNSAQCRPTIAC